MKYGEFLARLEEVLEMDRGTLKGREKLSDVDGWNSLAILGYIALIDELFSVSINAEEIKKCLVVDDLVMLSGQNFER